ncbi:MAG: competence/damage-inducible protein A [Chlorobiales bacterium]|nr:competence/damage-inducible protein A [Chlorobiales bacterium]
MHAEVISIGDELLIGQVVNTNASFITARLDEIGIPTERVVTIGDTPESIRQQLQESLEKADLVVTTGGLGPTNDDVTKKVIAGFFGLGYEFNQESYERCKARFDRRGVQMPESNRSQGEVIAGSIVLQNTRGTAPGMILKDLKGYPGKYVVIMPGVPFEMEEMVRISVLPFFMPLSRLSIKHTTLMTAGIGESTLAEMIGDEKEWIGKGTSLAYLPHSAGVRLRVTTKGALQDEVEEANDASVAEVIKRVGKFLYATTDMLLEEYIGKLLKERGLRMTTAESCTGGLIANRITNIPGSSDYFDAGFVVYSNEAKVRSLGVSKETLDRFGAVSEEVAIEMAQGCLWKIGADIAISTTGIAGPGGATETKPVGMVCIGLVTNEKLGNQKIAKTMTFTSDRLRNKERFSEAALNLVRGVLTEGKASL